MSQIDWALGAGWEGGNGTALTLIKSRAPRRGFTAEIESKWVRALKPGVASWRGWSRQVHSAVDNSRNLWRLRGWKQISREHARTVKRHLNSLDLQCSFPYPHLLLVPGVVSTWTVRQLHLFVSSCAVWSSLENNTDITEAVCDTWLGLNDRREGMLDVLALIYILIDMGTCTDNV